MDRVLSGMRPTGRLHLGHFVGALDNWRSLQDKYECLYMIADWHALTTDYSDTSKIQENVKDMLIDWLAVGISPEKSTLFLQSDIPEHAELHLLLSIITPISWLERNPTYREQKKELGEERLSTYGFLGYPVLQSADILIYKATLVPVGEDQLPHLELTREITRRFNYLYGEVFPVPAPLLTKTSRLPGIDGRKMSKSFDNCIYISDSEKTLREKVRHMITDTERPRLNDPGHPSNCRLFPFHTVFNAKRVSKISIDCKEAKIGCTDCKEELSHCLIEYLKDIQIRRHELEATPKLIIDILEEGAERARKIAKQTMEEIREALKISYKL
ncbi:MAG: tryptophan--tRNA ligase [bacterium]|nr:tryptophan--tRNA ligase [bacterium]